MLFVAKAEELKDNTDFEATTPIMKQIQDEWKKIGMFLENISIKKRAEFKGACNHYFDRLKEQKVKQLAKWKLLIIKKPICRRTYQLTGITNRSDAIK
jgi:hypothetical protein